jgi:CBS domain containing-hemolysin-like protein
MLRLKEIFRPLFRVGLMNNHIFISIAFGICSGAFLCYWSSRPLALRLSNGSESPRLVLWCSAIVALLAALPAFLLSFIVGGNLSEVLLDAVSFSTSLGSILSPVGLAISTAIVFGGGLAIAIVVGGLIGRLLAYVLRKLAQTKHSDVLF